MLSSLFLAMMLAASSLAAAETPLTIDQLLAQGWEIAGYASGYDNRQVAITTKPVRSDRIVYLPVSGIPKLAMSCCNSLAFTPAYCPGVHSVRGGASWMGGVSLGLMSRDMCRML
jgi:hypothetical protein